MGPRHSPSSAEMQDDDLLDLRKLKSVAVRLLPPNSLLRKIIMTEPDYIPRSEGRVKLPLFARMLDEELKSPQ